MYLLRTLFKKKFSKQILTLFKTHTITGRWSDPILAYFCKCLDWLDTVKNIIFFKTYLSTQQRNKVDISVAMSVVSSSQDDQ